MTDLEYFKKQNISHWVLKSDGSPYANMYIGLIGFSYETIVFIEDLTLVFDFSDKFIGIYDSKKMIKDINFKEFLDSLKSGSKFNLF